MFLDKHRDKQFLDRDRDRQDNEVDYDHDFVQPIAEDGEPQLEVVKSDDHEYVFFRKDPAKRMSRLIMALFCILTAFIIVVGVVMFKVYGVYDGLQCSSRARSELEKKKSTLDATIGKGLYALASKGGESDEFLFFTEKSNQAAIDLEEATVDYEKKLKNCY